VIELLVALGILVILLAIFIPYLLSVRERSNRTTCADKLRQIRDALQAYALVNDHNFPSVRYDPAAGGYAAYSGADEPDPFAPTSTVRPNDVTASLWLLVRERLIADTIVFVCPSTNDYRDRISDAAGRVAHPKARSNFRSPSNLSYSYASPFSSAPNYRLNDYFLDKSFALVADKNPGVRGAGDDVTAPAYDADAIALSKANSNNHGKAGQNVVYGDGHVEFTTTPYCGVAYAGLGRDNIYTARAPHPTTQPTSAPVYINGFCGRDIAPAAPDDSYLVPTDDDPISPPFLPPTSTPATTTTTPVTGSAPAAATTSASTTTSPS
jgi:prepilin-type processing-associated H-X9-DG protein